MFFLLDVSMEKRCNVAAECLQHTNKCALLAYCGVKRKDIKSELLVQVSKCQFDESVSTLVVVHIITSRPPIHATHIRFTRRQAAKQKKKHIKNNYSNSTRRKSIRNWFVIL